MALFEKRHLMPPYLAEIPYGFKNIWQITVSIFDLSTTTFDESAITEIILNGSPVTAQQMEYLFDFNRDYASLRQEGAESGILVTLRGLDEATRVYTFETVVSQSLEIAGVLGVDGDMVDSSNPQRPYINHDVQKLDVTTYTGDQAALNTRLTTDETNIANNSNAIANLTNNAITNITLNGDPVPKVGGTAAINIAALTPDELASALATKVDKTVAGVGGTIIKATSDSFTGTTLTLNKQTLSLETGATANQTTSYDLAALLGIDAITAMDKELFYFCDESVITSYGGLVVLPYTALYRYNDNGTKYVPTSADNIQAIYGLSINYTGVNVAGNQYVSAIGTKVSRSDNNISTTFTNLRLFARYSIYNGYRMGQVVYDPDTNAIFEVIQPIPRPQTVGAIIPITNTQYYRATVDNSPMVANTIFANFEDYPNPGKDYTVDQARIELMRGETREFAGYNEYIDFKTDVIPAQILTPEDWTANINLWVTDGRVFTELADLNDYLSNYTSPFRYKLSNRGIIRTQAEAGGINIRPLFDIAYIESQVSGAYMPTVPTATSGNLAIFNNQGQVADSATAITGLATSQQGALADTAVQAVSLSPGTANGTVVLDVDGNDTEVAVTGLNTAAYHPDTDFATTAQGAKADTALQSVVVASGTQNGTVKVTTGNASGNSTVDNIAVTGLNTAAYQPATAFATATQGSKADSAVQTVVLAPGAVNGSVMVTVNGTAQTANVTGLGSAAYQASSAFATSVQGGRADTALQPASVVDNLTSTATNAPLSANQGRILDQKIESIASSGKYIGGFATYADVPKTESGYPSDLQPVNVNDFVYIAADENNGDQPAEYRVSVNDGGNLTFTFVRLVPDSARDFTISQIQTNEISDGAVTDSKLAGNSVGTGNVQDLAITRAKLSQNTQDSLDKADNSLQAPIETVGSGNNVSGINLNADNTLRVTYDNVIKNINVTGNGSFLDEASLANGTLTLNKSGTAVQGVEISGAGNAIIDGSYSEGVFTLNKGTLLANVGAPNGTGNTVTGISASSGTLTATLAQRLASIAKSGTGNVISGVSTDANGAVTLASDTMLKSLTVTGTGNVIGDISASGATITATRATALTSVPDASTSQAGTVQLNDTLTSTSTTQAATANAARQLQANITAADNSAVHIENSETITGAKTFNLHPIVPSKTVMPATPAATQYASEAQVATRYGKITNPVNGNLVGVNSSNELTDSGLAAINLVVTTDPRMTNARPASDVSAWAKAATKPTYTAAEVNAVPTTRTVNSKALSDNITLSASDIGADVAGAASTAVSNHDASNTAHQGLFNAKQNTITANGILKANGGGVVSAAVAKTDYAIPATETTASLSANNWTGTTAPFTYVLAVSGVTATSIQEILPPTNVTAAQLTAMQAANITDGGQTTNQITLRAFGVKPTIALPIRIIIRGDM